MTPKPGAAQLWLLAWEEEQHSYNEVHRGSIAYMDVMHDYNLASVSSACATASVGSGAGAVATSSSSSNLPNYPRQLCGSYNFLMHLLY